MDKEYDVQKALGLLKLFLCDILYHDSFGWNEVQGHGRINDIILESYGEGPAMDTQARIYMNENGYKDKLFHKVIIKTEVLRDRIGKYHGSNPTP